MGCLGVVLGMVLHRLPQWRKGDKASPGLIGRQDTGKRLSAGPPEPHLKDESAFARSVGVGR